MISTIIGIMSIGGCRSMSIGMPKLLLLVLVLPTSAPACYDSARPK